MKTVQIEEAVCFANGKRMIAAKLNVVSVSDNLFDQVVFRYTLFGGDGQWAGESTFELNGLDQYTTWDATPAGAYRIVAAGIGVQIAPVAAGEKLFVEVV